MNPVWWVGSSEDSLSEPKRSEGQRSEAEPTLPNWIQKNLATKRRDQTGGLIESSMTSLKSPPPLPGYGTAKCDGCNYLKGSTIYLKELFGRAQARTGSMSGIWLNTLCLEEYVCVVYCRPFMHVLDMYSPIFHTRRQPKFSGGGGIFFGVVRSDSRHIYNFATVRAWALTDTFFQTKCTNIFLTALLSL